MALFVAALAFHELLGPPVLLHHFPVFDTPQPWHSYKWLLVGAWFLIPSYKWWCYNIDILGVFLISCSLSLLSLSFLPFIFRVYNNWSSQQLMFVIEEFKERGKRSTTAYKKVVKS